MADIMSSIDVEKSLKGMDGWSHNDVFNSISKEFSFDSFQSATTFVAHVCSIADEMGNYPDILIHNGTEVKITAMDSEAGGVTEEDIALIESLEILFSG